MDRDALILAHLQHVRRMAAKIGRWMGPQVLFEDLVADGCVGLITAADAYKPGSGKSFWSFAYMHVRGAMVDALRKDMWPRTFRKRRRELLAAREAILAETGEMPSNAELATRLGWTEKRLTRTAVNVATVEAIAGIAETSIDHDFDMAIEVDDTPFATYARAEVVERTFAILNPRERDIVQRYYFGEMSMKRIGAAIGVCEARVCQIHRRAIRRVREQLAASPRRSHGNVTSDLAEVRPHVRCSRHDVASLVA